MIANVANADLSSRLRNLNLTKDLDQVADLIELCFPIERDPDGQSYVNEMRKTAREMRLLGWLNSLAEFGNQKSAGFVWEEGGEIVGNLSLIPFHENGRRIHLIANVAVHPSHRRSGIARALTMHALSHLRKQGEPHTWLQVRQDNPAAISLYRSVGFNDEASQTTWRIRPIDLTPLKAAGNQIRLYQCQNHSWAQHKKWLASAYPAAIRWNLPVDFRRFEPGALQWLANFLDGIRLRHWGVARNGECAGVVTWQKSTTFADHLWLAFDEAQEAACLPEALTSVLKRLPRRHPLSVDYPQGRSTPLFEQLGFQQFRTLIWMKCRF
jgi:ribosomal protein S18 acetylase RimI-like enzyme